MADIDALKKALLHDEGLELKAYQDSKGIWTIGIGRNLQCLQISKETAEVWLEDDIQTVIQWMARFPWFAALNAVRQNVVLNMGFQLGQTRFAKFEKFIGFLTRQNYQLASSEMMLSKWAQVDCPRRAARLAQELLTGKSSL